MLGEFSGPGSVKRLKFRFEFLGRSKTRNLSPLVRANENGRPVGVFEACPVFWNWEVLKSS